jgi:hypothetical protein
MFLKPEPTPASEADPCFGCAAEADCAVWSFRVCYPCVARFEREASSRKAQGADDRRALASELFGAAKVLRLDRARGAA